MQLQYLSPAVSRVFVRCRDGSWETHSVPIQSVFSWPVDINNGEKTTWNIMFRPSTTYSYLLVNYENVEKTRLIRYTGHVLMPDQEVYFIRALSEEVLRAVKMDGIKNTFPELKNNADKDDQPHKPKMNAELKISSISQHFGQLAPSTVISICPKCLGTLFGKECNYDEADEDSKYPCECVVKSLSTNSNGIGTKDTQNLDKAPCNVLQFGPHSMPITTLGLSSSNETSIIVELTLPPYYFNDDQKNEMKFKGSFNSVDAIRCQIRGPNTIKERKNSPSGNWLSSVPQVLVCKLVNVDNNELSIDFPLEILYAKQWGSAKNSYRGLFAEYDEIHKKYVVKDSWKQYEGTYSKEYLISKDGVVISKRNKEEIESLIPKFPIIPRAGISPLKIDKIRKETTSENNDNPVQHTENKNIPNNFPIIIGHRGLGSNKIHFVSSSNNELTKIKECSSDLLNPITPGYRENTLHAFSAAFNLHHNKENDFAAVGIETDLQPLECGKASSRWTEPESTSILNGDDPFCGIKNIAICHEFMAPVKRKSDNITTEECEKIMKESTDISMLQMNENNKTTEQIEVKLLSNDYKHDQQTEENKKIKYETFCNEYNSLKKDDKEPKERLLSQITSSRFLETANDASWITSSSEKAPFSLQHPAIVPDSIMSCIKKSAADGNKSWLDCFNEYYNIPAEVTQHGSIPQHDTILVKPLFVCKEERQSNSDTDVEVRNCVRTFYPSSPITLPMLLSYLSGINKYFRETKSQSPEQISIIKNIRLFMNLEVKSLCRRVPWSSHYESRASLKSVLQHPPKFGFVNKELSIVSAETYKYVKESTDNETQLPIFFSSFDWMVAFLLTSQQNVYPVLYLTLATEWSEREMYATDTADGYYSLPCLSDIDKLDVSDDYSDVPIYDSLARVFPYAFTLCNGEEHGIDGVVSSVKSLRAAKDRELVTHKDEINKGEAMLLTYGSSIRDVCTTSFLFGGCGVDGVIVDGL